MKCLFESTFRRLIEIIDNLEADDFKEKVSFFLSFYNLWSTVSSQSLGSMHIAYRSSDYLRTGKDLN